MIGRLLRHASHYSVGTLLVTLAGFISFPLLTRALTVEEYGVLGALSGTLTLLVGLGKLGLQNAVLRFQPEAETGHLASRAAFNATVVWGMAASGLLVALGWIALASWVPGPWRHDPLVAGLPLLLAPLVVVRVLDSGLSNMLRAQQRSLALSAYQVVKRYASLAIVLGLVLGLAHGLRGFYLGSFAAELLTLLALGACLLRRSLWSPRHFSGPLWRSMAAFGLPMIAYELAGNLLAVGDRYVIGAVLGAEALGGYAAAYNLCEYVQAIALASVAQALVPIYARLWEDHGPAQTAEFLGRALHAYAILGTYVVVAMCVAGPDLLTLAASGKYRDGASVIPWVVAGMVLDVSSNLLGAGLFLQKRTRTIMAMVVVCAIVNLLLNLVLVPLLGTRGAAVATLLSYALLCALSAWLGRRVLPLRIDGMHLLKLCAVGTVAALLPLSLGLPAGWWPALLKLAAATACFALLLLASDREARRALGLLRARLPRPGLLGRTG